MRLRETAHKALFLSAKFLVPVALEPTASELRSGNGLGDAWVDSRFAMHYCRIL